MSSDMSLERPPFRPERCRSVPKTAHHAAETGNVKELTKTLGSSSQPEASVLQHHEGSMGMTPLHVAAEFGQREIVQVGLRFGMVRNGL